MYCKVKKDISHPNEQNKMKYKPLDLSSALRGIGVGFGLQYLFIEGFHFGWSLSLGIGLGLVLIGYYVGKLSD